MQFGVGMFQEVGDHVGAMPLGMLGLKDKTRVFLIALGREADIVKLNFISAGFGGLHGQRNVVLLNLGLRRIGPNQLAVLAPRLAGAMRLHRQLRMLLHQPLVAEDGHARNGVHILRMQKAHKLRQIVESRRGGFPAADARREC